LNINSIFLREFRQAIFVLFLREFWSNIFFD